MVPLRFRGEPLGVLASLDRLQVGPDLSGDDERLMAAFATSAAADRMTSHSRTWRP